MGVHVVFGETYALVHVTTPRMRETKFTGLLDSALKQRGTTQRLKGRNKAFYCEHKNFSNFTFSIVFF